ncbi:Conserved oligomeric Golgi complex subunit 5 [Frankliniella fusca]|uniref:Conserved oligomeric Golgi complex subunit 5 n=1 Tax=Frankliniella fusca TaxID=407009 RepID=A0AAE1HFL4_9NEOP|nr:Conserved oligomeric Golgi complex subunit 5 [Frankliniella fusca]
MSSNSVDQWRTIEQDEFYRLFLVDEDKQNLTKSAVSHTLAVSEQLSKLTEGISILDNELHKQVFENHEDLVSQATWVERLQSLLAGMHSQTQCVLSGVERLRARIMEPFLRMESHTLVLSRLHETSDLLRRIARLQQLSKKLQNCQDHVKAAALLNEIDQLSEDVDLSGLEILESDQATVQKHRVTVHKQAQTMLKDGLDTLNHQKASFIHDLHICLSYTNNSFQVTTAVMVFSNLGVLNTELNRILDTSVATLSNAISEALDIQVLTQAPTSNESIKSRGTPGRVVMPSLGNISSFRSKLWSALENLFEVSIYNQCSQIEVLQAVLHNQCNELGCKIQVPDDKKNMTDTFWTRVMKLLSQELVSSSQNSTYMKQALEGEFPKLLRLYVDLRKRLINAHTKTIAETSSSDLSPESSKQPYQFERELIARFENAYLSRSVSRLLDPVNLMFSETKAPTHENVDGLVRTITSELSVSLVDEALSKTVSKNISKAVHLFCIKCEQLVATGGDATQVIDIPSQAQTLNAAAANILHYLAGQLERVLNNMGGTLAAGPAAVVRESLGGIEKLVTTQILNPLLASIGDAIEAILLTMHDEDYAADEGSSINSLYMKELHTFIGRAINLYLSPFDDQTLVVNSVSVATRCIDLFLRLASLIRPLGKVGIAKLSADFEKLELALQPLAGRQPPADLGWGKHLRTLRSLRTLIGLPANEVAASPAVGTALPHSLVLTALFAQAPADLLSPHQSAGWSISRLSQWLDSHPAERDRLQLVGGCLQRYQQAVRQSGQAEFHPVYPIMVSLLEAGMTMCSN